MKVTHINSIPSFYNKAEKQKSSEKSAYGSTNIVSLPSYCDTSMISFTSRASRKREKRKLENSSGENKYNLPIFKPYVVSIIEILKELSSKNCCFLRYNKLLDSKEILLDNLRSMIDSGDFAQAGIEKDTPFYRINLMDFPDNYQEALKAVNKNIEKLTIGNKKPILIVENCRNFLNRIERPYDFVQSGTFKKYPTLFMVEEGFSLLSADEDKNYNLGILSTEVRPKDEIVDDRMFQRVFSKVSLLNEFGHDEVLLPHVDSETAFNLLGNSDVNKKLICKGRDINISSEGIAFAIMVGKALAFDKGDAFNMPFKDMFLQNEFAALEETISILRRAYAHTMMAKPNTKYIDEIDIAKSLPHDLYWQEICKNYEKMQQLTNLLIANTNISSEDEEKLKSEIDNLTAAKPRNNGNEGDKNTESITFADIGGMYNIKKQLKEEFIDILKNPEVKNSQKPNGILLSGPPGCGKTLLAKAIAGETKVPFLSIAGSSFVEVYVGVGAKRVRELYAKAREAAENHPSKTAIVFIDEVDAVAGSRRNAHANNEDLRTVNALLHEMDGANNKDENGIKIITIVATNHEDMLDDAFKRSGRIDLKYTIDDPRYSTKARTEIIKIHAKNLKFSSPEERIRILGELARSTAGMSGADLAELLKKADRMSMRIGRNQKYITEQDISEAKMQVLAGVKTDIEHTEYELRQTSARTAGYALNAIILEKIFKDEPNKHKVPSRILDFITNAARGKSLGSAYFKPSSENKAKSKETCLSDVIMLYGGYATESALFDTHSSAIDEDLKAATEIIENAVSNSDFGSEKHYLSLTSNLTKSLFAQEIKDDMKTFSRKGMEISKTIINFAAPFIDEFSKEISKSGEYNDTISANEFRNKFLSWIEKNNKQEEYSKLCDFVKKEIRDFCGEKEKPHSGLGFSV